MHQLVSFDDGQGPALGLYQDGRCFAVPGFASMQDALERWDQARAAMDAAARNPQAPRANARLLAPLARPRNLYFTGANYTDHVQEMAQAMGIALPSGQPGQAPWFLLKSSSTVVGPGAVVPAPPGAECLDWEIELAVVIGREARGVPAERALDCVAGYTIANDLSARDRMARAGEGRDSPFRWDWMGHKSFDGACPMGPAITPAAQVADVQDLAMKLWVNGELMQDSSTARMIFGVAEQIAHLSRGLTLYPGDVILTGTPAGVGAARRRFLRPGDRVRQSIGSIGEFEFTIG